MSYRPQRPYRYRPPQQWAVGSTVNIGFLKGFTVTGKIPTPGDGLPDIWTLTRDGVEYQFQPHLGLYRETPPESGFPVGGRLTCR